MYSTHEHGEAVPIAGDLARVATEMLVCLHEKRTASVAEGIPGLSSGRANMQVAPQTAAVRRELGSGHGDPNRVRLSALNFLSTSLILCIPGPARAAWGRDGLRRCSRLHSANIDFMGRDIVMPNADENLEQQTHIERGLNSVAQPDTSPVLALPSPENQV